jgi:hypothetical protein
MLKRMLGRIVRLKLKEERLETGHVLVHLEEGLYIRETIKSSTMWASIEGVVWTRYPLKLSPGMLIAYGSLPDIKFIPDIRFI